MNTATENVAAGRCPIPVDRAPSENHRRRWGNGPEAAVRIVLTARGSSDHAAIYGRYVLQIASRRPVALAAPSLHTLYGSGIDCSGYLAIATSPSGRTAEIVSVLREYARSGAASIAVTNDPTESPERSR